MKFEASHFNPASRWNPESVALLEKLDTRLQKILEFEIEEGNRVFEVSGGWPESDSVFVKTSRPFRNGYEEKGIEFRKVNDPHYWKEEYTSKKPTHILACPF
ncbi:hypothetical protein JIN87_27815 [Pelagicoccus mobilis]|uniref:Uncharacterized protein n=2 Tax=Pelagicoccus mobilis TaxID=415221 RepID=A0A934S1N1_9BACT|nr:hypothetical protein [Pelagicoccus mobilis]